MKKKIPVITILGLIVSVGLVMGLFHIWHSFTDYSRILHANWGFTWPTAAHCSEIYQKDSGASFQGDGIRYHVFSCKESTSIDQLFEWQSEQNETNYHDSFVDAVDDWLDEIEVPLAQRPDYNACLFWYESQADGSEIIVFWDQNKHNLYTVESFL